MFNFGEAFIAGKIWGRDQGYTRKMFDNSETMLPSDALVHAVGEHEVVVGKGNPLGDLISVDRHHFLTIARHLPFFPNENPATSELIIC